MIHSGILLKAICYTLYKSNNIKTIGHWFLWFHCYFQIHTIVVIKPSQTPSTPLAIAPDTSASKNGHPLVQ